MELYGARANMCLHESKCMSVCVMLCMYACIVELCVQLCVYVCVFMYVHGYVCVSAMSISACMDVYVWVSE